MKRKTTKEILAESFMELSAGKPINKITERLYNSTDPHTSATVTEDGVRFSDRCEVCYVCLHNCPRNAIHLRREANTVRFRNEHVTPQDIIGANEQGGVNDSKKIVVNAGSGRARIHWLQMQWRRCTG